MKLATCYVKHICFAILAGCTVLSTSAMLSSNLKSSQLQIDRSKALDTVAKHSLVNNCMEVTRPMLLGDVIQLDGEGKSPTACFKDPKGNTGYAAYLGNQLQVQYLYTSKELNSQISVIKKGN